MHLCRWLCIFVCLFFLQWRSWTPCTYCWTHLAAVGPSQTPVRPTIHRSRPSALTIPVRLFPPLSRSAFTRQCISLVSFIGRLFWVDLIKWVSNVRPSVRTSVRPSSKSFFDFNDIWHVGRGRWVMHDGMQYDPIQGQGQVMSHWKLDIVPSLKAISSAIYNGRWKLTTDS